jgi:serine protease Do
METMRGRSRGKRSLLLALVIGAGLASPLWSPPGLAAEPGGSAVSIQLPSLAPLVARVAPAVVAVAAVESAKLASGGEESAGSSSPRSVEELVRHFFDNGVGGEHVVALGSGFIIDPQGYIVTSNELATRGDKLNVTLADNTSHPARVIGRDDTTDLALIKIETHRKLPSLTWGNSDAAAVGDWVIAIGNSFGLGGTVTAGIISALGRRLGDGSYDDLMQIDAPINRGDSGGPTFDLSGRVIGVNTALYSPSGGSAGIGFAVPANIAKKVIAQLRTRGYASWGWLGISLKGMTPSLARRLGLDPERPQGALVASVVPNGPAARAGLKPGDVIIAAGGRPIADSFDLPRLIEQASIGSRLALLVRRRGRDRIIAAKIAERPPRGGPIPPPARVRARRQHGRHEAAGD